MGPSHYKRLGARCKGNPGTPNVTRAKPSAQTSSSSSNTSGPKNRDFWVCRLVLGQMFRLVFVLHLRAFAFFAVLVFFFNPLSLHLYWSTIDGQICRLSKFAYSRHLLETMPMILALTWAGEPVHCHVRSPSLTSQFAFHLTQTCHYPQEGEMANDSARSYPAPASSTGAQNSCCNTPQNTRGKRRLRRGGVWGPSVLVELGLLRCTTSVTDSSDERYCPA